MHLLIRTYNAALANGLATALYGSGHKVVVESQGEQARERADAEYLSMSMAEVLGLSASLEPFKITFTKTPPEITWLPAPLVIIGMVVDQEYSRREELFLLIKYIWRQAKVHNSINGSNINIIGFHQDFLGFPELNINTIAQAIFEATVSS